MIDIEQLKQQAVDLKLYGLLAHWHEIPEAQYPWLRTWLNWEQAERKQRSLDRRLTSARLGRFKSLNEFDWQWPDKIDQQAIHRLMQLAYTAVMQGYTVLYTSAANMLNDLAAQDGDNALRRRLKHYARPAFLLIDEVGYLSYSNRHADLLFEIISQRYELRSTLVTTNRPFGEWSEVFPNAACVVSLDLSAVK